MTASLHPLLERLFTKHGAVEIDAVNFAVTAERPGNVLLFFSEDPARYRETLDLAVIVPEIAKAFSGRFTVGVLLPEAARTLHPRYGFRRWPALVLLKDGRYVGAIDGLRNWDEYLDEVARLLDAVPTRPPTVGIPVNAAAGSPGACSA